MTQSLVLTNFKGYYSNLAALQAAVPVGAESWWAIVASGNAVYIWNAENNSWGTSSGGGSGAVNSVFGREGDVTAENGDYNASQIDSTPFGSISATNVQDAMEAIYALTGGTTNFGVITLPATFPTPTEVLIGSAYFIFSDVTDNDPTKTNTGQSFVAGQIITYNGTNYTEAQIQTDWNQTDTTARDYIKNKPVNLDFFDAIVDGTGGSTGKYATLSLALSDGKVRIFISNSFTESAECVIADNTYIAIASGVIITMGLNRIGVATSKILTMWSADNSNSYFLRSPSVANSLIYGAGSGSQVLGDNIRFSNPTTNSNTPITSGIKATFRNCISIAQGSGNGFNFDTLNSWSYNCIAIIASTTTADIFKADYGEHYNLYISNAVGSTVNILTNGTNSTIVNAKYAGNANCSITNSGKIFGWDYISTFTGSISITAAANNTSYQNIALNAGSFTAGVTTGGYINNLKTTGNINTTLGSNNWKFDNVTADTISLTGNTNSIVNSTATSSFTSSGTGTIKSGNNSVIGNNYDAITGTHATTWSGPYASPVSGANISYSLEDGNVNLLLSAIISSATTPSVINMTSVLPSTLWPSITQVLPILIVSASVNAWGVLRVDTSGNIQIWSSSATSSTFAAGNSGFYAATITYKI